MLYEPILTIVEHHILDVLTTMETCRPQDLNLYVRFEIESYVLIEKM